jgi:hypothetical protein
MLHAKNFTEMTKNITPVAIWHNGQTVSAVAIRFYCIQDDLETQAIYYYELRSTTDILTAGNLTLTGTSYDDRDSNQYVIDWVASQLTLTYTT